MTAFAWHLPAPVYSAARSRCPTSIGSGQFLESAREELMLVVGLGEIEGAGVRRPGVARSPGATEELGPGRMVVAVGVKAEGVEEGKARVRAVQLCYRHGAVELDHRRSGALGERPVE